MVAPLLKWPGGKTRELPVILDALPDRMARLVDPFVGGGALLFATPPTVPAVVNDASQDLVDLYRRVQAGDEVFVRLAGDLAGWWERLVAFAEGEAAPLVAVFDDRLRDPATVVAAARPVTAGVVTALRATVPPSWSTIEPLLAHEATRGLPAKLGRMRAVERRRAAELPAEDVTRNVEGALRAALYTAIRVAYNDARQAREVSPAQAVRFLFLREYAYAAMFRFNTRGDFNVPYGGISYNRKPFLDRVAHLTSPEVVARLAVTEVHQGDFGALLDGVALQPDDVVFLDPPYDSDFSTYDRNRFGARDHERLAAAMRRLPCPFLLVIRDTPMVRGLYGDPAWDVRAFDRTYAWTIKERNDRRTRHLVVTNHPAGILAAG